MEYGKVIKPKEPKNPPIALLPVREGLTVAYPAFGSATYQDNVQDMQKLYSRPETGETIRLREPLTQESLEVSALGFGSKGDIDFKRDILDLRWLQAGRRVGTKHGIFFNTAELDQEKLSYLLSTAQEHNGVYLLSNGISYVEHENIKQGVQKNRDFVQSPLARALDHTKEEVASNLATIASEEHYPRGVDVFGFDKTKEPVSRVVSLYSGRYHDGRLSVNGYGWVGSCAGGFAFGVCETGKAS